MFYFLSLRTNIILPFTMCALHEQLLLAKQENRDKRDELSQMQGQANLLVAGRITLSQWNEALEDQRVKWQQKRADMWEDLA